MIQMFLITFTHLMLHHQWPFVRLFGLQEPASVLFSILNLFSHVIMIYKFRSKVTASCPLYKTTHIYCLVSWLHQLH